MYPPKLYIFTYPGTEVTITRLCLGKYCLNANLDQIDKHQDDLYHHCNKLETTTHFLMECNHNATCSSVLADFKNKPNSYSRHCTL